jgi:hypothetical protein
MKKNNKAMAICKNDLAIFYILVCRNYQGKWLNMTLFLGIYLPMMLDKV